MNAPHSGRFLENHAVLTSLGGKFYACSSTTADTEVEEATTYPKAALWWWVLASCTCAPEWRQSWEHPNPPAIETGTVGQTPETGAGRVADTLGG